MRFSASSRICRAVMVFPPDVFACGRCSPGSRGPFSPCRLPVRALCSSVRATTDRADRPTIASSTTPRQRRQRRPPPRPLASRAPAAPTGRARIGSPAWNAPQVVGQLLGAGVAPGRLLAQALQADRLQVARHLRLPARRRHRLVAAPPAASCPAPSPPLNGGRPVRHS